MFSFETGVYSLLHTVCVHSNKKRETEFVLRLFWCRLINRFVVEEHLYNCNRLISFDYAVCLCKRKKTKKKNQFYYNIKHWFFFSFGLFCFFVFLFPVMTCPSLSSFSLDHGKWRIVNGSHYEYGTKIIFTCNPGYYRIGPAHIQCLANGVWSWRNERPRCRSEWLRLHNTLTQHL